MVDQISLHTVVWWHGWTDGGGAVGTSGGTGGGGTGEVYHEPYVMHDTGMQVLATT